MQRRVLSVRTTIQELWVPLSRSFPSPVLWDFMNLHYIIDNGVCYWGSAHPSAPVLPVEVRGATGSPKLLIMLWSFWWKVFPCKKLPRIPSYYQVAPLHVKASLITEFWGLRREWPESKVGWGMAQWVKCLIYKHKDLCSSHQHPCKN